MSLSRIIKSSTMPDISPNFLLEEFHVGERIDLHPVTSGFQRLWESNQDDSDEVVAPPPPPPPEIDIEELLAGMVREEEAQQREMEAYDSGFAEGRRQFEEEFSRMSQTFSQAVVEISGLREQLIRDCEDDLLRLVIMLVERIIRQEISLDRKILARFVIDALENIDEQDELVIRFNPQDYQMVSENRYLDFSGLKDTRKITMKPDETITPGGCIIDAPTGQVDGRIEAQLAEIFERLMEQRALSHEESPDSDPPLFGDDESI